MKIFETIRETLQDKEVKIVLPEGEEPRILQATKRLVKETSIIPVLLGNPEKIRIYLEIEGVRMLIILVSCSFILEKCKGWFLVQFTLLQAQFDLLFKLSKPFLGFLVHQVLF